MYRWRLSSCETSNVMCHTRVLLCAYMYYVWSMTNVHLICYALINIVKFSVCIHCHIFTMILLSNFSIKNWKQYLFSIIGKIMIKGKSHTDFGSVDFNLMWFYLRYFVRKPKLFGEIGRLRSHRILSREEKRLHQSPWLIKECYNETLHRRHKKIRHGIMLQ